MIDKHIEYRQTAASGALSRRAFLGGTGSLGVAATAAAGPFGAALADAPDKDGKLFLIALEEHFATPGLRRRQTGKDERLFAGGGRRPELLDLGAGRIADMDEAGIGIQVLSAVTPGAQNLPGGEGVAFARKLNDRIAGEVIAAYPDRFRAFATLPLSEPEAAADELERTVREHGFVGCMSYGPVEGRFLDHADFAPLLARAEALGAPIYIHPNWPSPEATAVYYDGLGDSLASKILGGPGYGWHQEIALHCLRLIVSGTFDRFPRLQIVVGHMGEGLPLLVLAGRGGPRPHRKEEAAQARAAVFPRQPLDHDQRLLPRRAAGARARDLRRGPDHVLGRLSHGERQGGRRLDAGGRPAPGHEGEDRARERPAAARDRLGLKARSAPECQGSGHRSLRDLPPQYEAGRGIGACAARP